MGFFEFVARPLIYLSLLLFLTVGHLDSAQGADLKCVKCNYRKDYPNNTTPFPCQKGSKYGDGIEAEYEDCKDKEEGCYAIHLVIIQKDSKMAVGYGGCLSNSKMDCLENNLGLKLESQLTRNECVEKKSIPFQQLGSLEKDCVKIQPPILYPSTSTVAASICPCKGDRCNDKNQVVPEPMDVDDGGSGLRGGIALVFMGLIIIWTVAFTR